MRWYRSLCGRVRRPFAAEPTQVPLGPLVQLVVPERGRPANARAAPGGGEASGLADTASTLARSSIGWIVSGWEFER